MNSYAIDIPLRLSLEVFTKHNGMIDVGAIWILGHWRVFVQYPDQDVHQPVEYLGMLRIPQASPERELAYAVTVEWIKTASHAAGLAIVNTEQHIIADVPIAECFAMRLQLWHS